MSAGEDKGKVLALLRKRGARGIVPEDFSGTRILGKFQPHIRWLRSQGYDIELVQGRRYVLVREPEPYQPRVSTFEGDPPEPHPGQESLFD